MYYAMVEVSGFRQISSLTPQLAAELRELLHHFSQNRGGEFIRDQDGFFLFRFSQSADQALDRVADFLLLTKDSLDKRKDDLFGFNLLFEINAGWNDDAAFGQMKALMFDASGMEKIWAGPEAAAVAAKTVPLEPGEVLSELLGPPQVSGPLPLTVEELFSVTGWVDGLKEPLRRQLEDPEVNLRGKILRLKGAHLEEKAFVLRTVLSQLYGKHDRFPLFFPLTESHDVLVQLLAQIDALTGDESSSEAMADWGSLLRSRGGDDYSGDFGTHDVKGALRTRFLDAMQGLIHRELPPVFVFLVPDRYLLEAQSILEEVLSELVSDQGLHLLLVESSGRTTTFLSREPSLSWTFPVLSREKIAREVASRDWGKRLPHFDAALLNLDSGRGMGVAHALWAWQTWGASLSPDKAGDPSQAILESLDATHHRITLALWASGGLLSVAQITTFFREWGEDPHVVAEKLDQLQSLGVFLGTFPGLLRPDWGQWLLDRLGEESQRLLQALGRFHFKAWEQERRLSEILFTRLKSWRLEEEAVAVLQEYVQSRIQQGQRHFLRLLRPSLWSQGCSELTAERLKILSASSKLRWSLNLPFDSVSSNTLPLLTRWFGPTTILTANAEWSLQQGRLCLSLDEIPEGFSFLKKALAEAQNGGDPRVEIRTYIELGMALMRRKRSDEGREYLEIGVRLGEKADLPASLVVALSSLATAQFMSGQLTSALSACRRGVELSEKIAQRSRTVFFLLLQARIQFELGAYEECKPLLARGLVLCQTYRLKQAEKLLSAWQGRVWAHSGNLEPYSSLAESEEPIADELYFQAEAAFLSHDLKKAEEALAKAAQRIPQTLPFGFGETITFRSTFADIEDRWLPERGARGVLQHQIEAFTALVDRLIRPSNAPLERFPELAANRALLEIDPHAPVFFYWYYLALPKEDGPTEALRLTLLGRSLKSAQTRSSRITDPVQRQEYLSRPYWNSRFYSESKQFKLA